MPLTNPEILKIVKNYLKDQIKLLNNDKGQKFSEFYSYLNKFYFSENSPFNPGNYDFYNSIIFQGNMTTSTNCLESLNRVLKELSGTGFLRFSKICKVLKTFKENALKNHANYTLNDNVRKRKSIVLDREEKLQEILYEFHELDYDIQLESVIDYAYTIGNIKNNLAASKSIENSSNIIRPVVTTEQELSDNTLNFSESEDSINQSINQKKSVKILVPYF